MLGNIWLATEKKEFAVPYYARIVRNYPLSPLVPNAKSRLKTLGAPIPQPDPQAVAWMTAELNAPRQHEALMKKPLRLIHTGPGQELRAAGTTGKRTMTPDSESETGVDVLRGGNQSQIGGAGTGIVATITPGGTGGATSGPQKVPPATNGGDATPAAQPDQNSPTTTENSASGTTGSGTTETTPKSGATATTEQSGHASKTDAA